MFDMLIIFLEDRQAFSSSKGGHGLNIKLVEGKKILQDHQKIELTQFQV